MDYFIKENKKFLYAVGGGLLFLLLYSWLVLGPIRKSADQAASRRSSEKRDLEKRMAQGVASDETLVLARRDRDQNRKVLAAMVPEIAFKVPDRFRKPERENAKAYYDNLKLDVKGELEKKAVAARMVFPTNLGLGDESSDEQAAELLLRLSIVERLATVAMESEVEKVEAIDGLYGQDRDERGARKAQFMARTSVLMRFSGKAEAVYKVLHGVQKKGSYLAATQFEMTRPDATKEIFDATIAVTQIKVDEKAALENR